MVPFILIWPRSVHFKCRSWKVWNLHRKRWEREGERDEVRKEGKEGVKEKFKEKVEEEEDKAAEKEVVVEEEEKAKEEEEEERRRRRRRRKGWCPSSQCNLFHTLCPHPPPTSQFTALALNKPSSSSSSLLPLPLRNAARRNKSSTPG